MKCPNCYYDVFPIYEKVLGGRKSKYVKLGFPKSEFSLDALYTYSWKIKCKCPKCGTEWEEEDSNY